jgi:thiol-disulfide isomerase/thioredoxin
VVSLIGFSVIGLAGMVTLGEIIEGTLKRSKRLNEAPLNALWELLRLQRRKYGGYLVHIGIILMAIGVVGTRLYPFEQETTFTYGQPVEIDDYTLIYENLQQEPKADYTSTWATIAVYKGDSYLTTLEPRLNQYSNSDQSITVPALHPSILEDLYIILSGWSSSGDLATFKVVINPLINFLWMGGLIFLAGGGIALWPRFKKQSWNTLALISGVILLVGAGWAMWGIPHGEVSNRSGRPLLGQSVPNFRLISLDGSPIELYELEGKVVVVNFWASWCPPCVDEMPALQALWEAYQNKNVEFIGIAYQEQEDAVREAILEFGTSYTVGLDSGDAIAENYSITGVPETFVIDQQGELAFFHLGPVTFEQLASELDTLLTDSE